MGTFIENLATVECQNEDSLFTVYLSKSVIKDFKFLKWALEEEEDDDYYDSDDSDCEEGEEEEMGEEEQYESCCEADEEKATSFDSATLRWKSDPFHSEATFHSDAIFDSNLASSSSVPGPMERGTSRETTRPLYATKSPLKERGEGQKGRSNVELPNRENDDNVVVVADENDNADRDDVEEADAEDDYDEKDDADDYNDADEDNYDSLGDDSSSSADAEMEMMMKMVLPVGFRGDNVKKTERLKRKSPKGRQIKDGEDISVKEVETICLNVKEEVDTNLAPYNEKERISPDRAQMKSKLPGLSLAGDKRGRKGDCHDGEVTEEEAGEEEEAEEEVKSHFGNNSSRPGANIDEETGETKNLANEEHITSHNITSQQQRQQQRLQQLSSLGFTAGEVEQIMAAERIPGPLRVYAAFMAFD